MCVTDSFMTSDSQTLGLNPLETLFCYYLLLKLMSCLYFLISSVYFGVALAQQAAVSG